MSTLQDVASQIGLPTGAVALAVGIVQGAKFLEKDANPQALQYVSTLIQKGNLADIGKVGASLVPFMFDKTFGRNPFSFQFISRSIVATTVFWLILLILKHPNWTILENYLLFDFYRYISLLIPLWFVLDWLSLVKGRFFITRVSQRRPATSSLSFVIIDTSCSYILALFATVLISLFYYNFYSTNIIPSMIPLYVDGPERRFVDLILFPLLSDYARLIPLKRYIYMDPTFMKLDFVVVPSTMLTSVWTLLFFVSAIIA